jgi:imidazolonepropionase-like amidohydrolase
LLRNTARRRTLCIVLWTLAAMEPSPSGELTAQDVALVGGTVVTATGSEPLVDATVVVRGGVIETVGPRGAIDVPDGIERVDASGQWIIPGLIDTNVHLILMTTPEFFVKYEDRLTDIAIQSAQVGLKFGLTTMMDTWGPLGPLLEARDRIARGEVSGSRVLIAGNAVGFGGPFSPYFMGGWGIKGPTLRYGGWVHPMIRSRIDALWEDDVGPALLAMTPQEAGEALRAYIRKGVDFVKVAVSGHGIGPVEPLMFSENALHVMRRVAREEGVHFQTHTFSVESLRIAVELEPDLLQHPNVMSMPWTYASDRQKESIRASIARIREEGIPAALMAIPEREQMRVYAEWDGVAHADDPYLNEIMLYRQQGMARTSFEDRAAGLRPWLEAGVTATLATDAGPDAAELGPVVWGRLGRAHFDRMVGLQDNGLTPMEVLIAATRNGARAYGLGDRIGTIEVGKEADLVVLNADPLADIANVREIALVLKGGRVVDRDTLPTVKVLDYDPEARWPR